MFVASVLLFVDSQNLKKYVGSAIDVTEHELLTQELRGAKPTWPKRKTQSHRQFRMET